MQIQFLDVQFGQEFWDEGIRREWNFQKLYTLPVFYLTYHMNDIKRACWYSDEIKDDPVKQEYLETVNAMLGNKEQRRFNEILTRHFTGESIYERNRRKRIKLAKDRKAKEANRDWEEFQEKQARTRKKMGLKDQPEKEVKETPSLSPEETQAIHERQLAPFLRITPIPQHGKVVILVVSNAKEAVLEAVGAILDDETDDTPFGVD